MLSPAPIRADRRDPSRQAAPQVLERLREMIVSLELAPGAVVSRAELQERFGLSSTPIRDALLKLQDEGLVEVFPQHATLVSPIDVDRARQAQFLRRSVEAEVAHALALTEDKPFLPRLRSTVAQQRAVLEAGDYATFTQLDQAFHRLMYDAAGVPTLWATVRASAGHVDRLRRLDLPSPGKGEQILRDHAAIIEAIAAGDPGAAQASVREHLSGTLSRVDAIRERHPAYFRG